MIGIGTHFIIAALVTGVFVWDALRMRRKIDGLRAALTAKQVMSGVTDCSGIGVATVGANDTIVFRTSYGRPINEITSSAMTTIDFKVLT